MLFWGFLIIIIVEHSPKPYSNHFGPYTLNLCRVALLEPFEEPFKETPKTLKRLAPRPIL